MSLEKVLKDFTNIFGREDEDIGNLIYDEDFIVKKENDLDSFYGLLKFERLITIGGELFLNIQSFENLNRSQLGWFIFTDKEGNQKEDNENWNKDWIVFGDRNGDAIYYNKTNNFIEGSINKQQKFILSNSLEVFFQILNDCMILEKEKYEFETVDDDEETLPEFMNDVYTILNKHLNKEIADDFMSFFFE